MDITLLAFLRTYMTQAELKGQQTHLSTKST